MTKEMQSFISASEQCLLQCRDMLEHEREKRKALLSSDTAKIEAVLKSQQAAVMMLENLEKKRIEAQNAAGYSNLTASEVIEKETDPEAKQKLTAILDDWRKVVEEMKYLNKKSTEIAAANLRAFEGIMNIPSGEASPTYGRTQRQSNSMNKSFEEKI